MSRQTEAEVLGIVPPEGLPVARAVVSGRREAVVAALAGLEEKVRRSIAPPLIAARKSFTRWDRDDETPSALELRDDRLVRRLPPGAARLDGARVPWRRIDNQRQALALAILGTGSLADYRTATRFLIFLEDLDEHEAEILRDRRPRWLEDWALWLLEDQQPRSTRYQQLRAVLDLPQLKALRGPRLTSALIAATWTWADDAPAGEPRGATAMLTDLPDLLEDEVWDLFSEPGERVKLTADRPLGTEDGGADTRWSTALVTGAQDGSVPRERLLDECLRGMARDFTASEQSWFRRIWDALGVTAAERTARAELLTRLLGSPHPRVVAFALGELKKVASTGGAEPGWIPLLQAGTTSPAKAAVRSALTLLDRIVKDHPDSAAEAGRTAILALGNPDAHLQGAALERVERWYGDDLATDLLGYLDLVSPTLRPRLEERVGLAGLEDDDAGASVEDLTARIAALPEEVRRGLGLDAVTADRIPGWIPGLAPGEPVLDPDDEVRPIQTVAELDDALTELLATSGEHAHRVNDTDLRVVDAVLRWGDQPFPPTLLAHRAHLEGDVRSEWWTPHLGVLAARSWLEGKTPPGGFVGNERHLLLARLGQDTSGLLFLPTHRSGWIAPVELARRLTEHGGGLGSGDDHVAGDLEVAKALVALAPDGREEAVSALEHLAGRRVELLRHALGGPEAEPGHDFAWAAADLVRSMAGRAITFRHGQVTDSTWSGREETHGTLHIRVEPPLPEVGPEPRDDEVEGPAEDLTRSLHGQREGAGRTYRWMATPPPAHEIPAVRDLGAALAISAAYDGLVGTGSVWTSGDYLEQLLHPSEPMTPTAARHVLVMLATADARMALIAVDVAVAAIEDGRLGPEPLGEVLRWGLAEGVLKAGRVAQRLGEVASASPVCGAVVRRVLEVGVGLAEAPPNLVRLLTLLDELLAPGQVRVGHEPARELLSSLTGSSGAARAAGRLLRYAADPTDAGLLWEARVVRAERWARIAG